MMWHERGTETTICTKIRKHMPSTYTQHTNFLFFFQCQTKYNEIDGQVRAFQNICIFIHFMRLLFNNNNIPRYFYAVAREWTHIFSKQTQSSETLSFVHLTRKPLWAKTKCATSGNSQCNAVNINNYANEIWFNIKIPARKKEKIY